VSAAGLINNAAALLQASRFEEAIAQCEAALALAPEDARALNNMGLALDALGRHSEAVAAFERALAAKPDHASARINRGAALAALGRVDEALASFDSAAELNPASVDIPYYRGLALARAGRRAEAMRAFDAALALAPGDADVLYAKGAALLAFGAYDEAWPLYGARWRARRIRMSAPRDFGEPRWRGQALEGPLRIWPEQGIGEEILFSALAPLARARTGQVMLECAPRLAPLFARSFADIDVAPATAARPAPVAAQIAIGDLAGALGMAAPFADGPRPLLRADEARRAAIRARYEMLARGRPIVGVSWFSKNAEFGARKSAALSEWGALLSLPCLFVNLQYMAGAAEMAAARSAFGCDLHDDAEIDQVRDLDGFAAQVAAMDRVVTVSNTTAHMAGALGVACSVLAPSGAGRLWYWGASGETTPWYESVRVPPPAPGASWHGVVAQAAETLRV
jgi:Tetratricopeptide repeat